MNTLTSWSFSVERGWFDQAEGLYEWNNSKRKETFVIFAKSFSKKIKQENLYLFDLKDIDKNLKKKIK